MLTVVIMWVRWLGSLEQIINNAIIKNSNTQTKICLLWDCNWKSDQYGEYMKYGESPNFATKSSGIAINCGWPQARLSIFVKVLIIQMIVGSSDFLPSGCMLISSSLQISESFSQLCKGLDLEHSLHYSNQFSYHYTFILSYNFTKKINTPSKK